MGGILKQSINTLIFLVFLLNCFALFSIDNIGQIGDCFINAGICYDIVEEENIAYIASQYGLFILDISDPESPQYLSSYKTPGTALSLDVHDNVVALCYLSSSVDFIDVSDITNPTKLSTYQNELSWQNIRSVTLTNNFAFICIDYNNSKILDLSDLNNPTVIHEFVDLEAEKTKVVGNVFYALVDAIGGLGFFVYDIEDCDNPVLMGSTNLPGEFPKNFEIQGNYAYFAAYNDNLQIIDISNPTNPQLIGECLLPDTESYDVTVNGNYAYLIGVGEMSYSVVDISNPYEPTLLAGFDYPGNIITNTGGNILISRRNNSSYVNNGIGILNIDNPAVFYIESEFRSGQAEKLKVKDEIAYIANGYRGLTILDVSNPHQPTTLSNFSTDDWAMDILLDSLVAYVAISEGGVQIIDISDPAEPSLISQLDPGYGDIRTLAKLHNYLYLGGEETGNIYLCDISDLENPQCINQIPVNDYSYDITIYDGYLYSAGYWGGMQIFDLSDPVNPTEVGYYPLGLALCVEAGENMAYIGDPYTSLCFFDTSLLSNPVMTESFEIGSVKDMHLRDNTLYVASSGLHSYDVSNAYDIVETLHIPDCYPLGISPTEDFIYSVEKFQLTVYGDTTIVAVEDPEIINLLYSSHLSNHPNPFNPTTIISYNLAIISEVEITVYNVKGQKVKTLINQRQAAGKRNVVWNGKDNFGKDVSSGIYYYNLSINGKVEAVNKCLLLK